MRKVFVYEYSKFFTVAKDVKVQLEFNPANVEAYRLIGYENRLLNEEDFEDDKEDAGEIGANQNITALYEIVPRANPDFRSVPTFTIDFRYKHPDEQSSIPLQLEIFDEGKSFQEATDFMKFVAGIASFSMVMTDSPYKGSSNYEEVLNWLDHVNLKDEHGFQAEFRSIVERAKGL